MRFKVERLGEVVEGVRIKGDPRHPESEAFRIVFPFGFVEVTRAVDSDPDTDYWVHVYVNNPLNKSYCFETDGFTGQIKNARLDQTDKHSSDCDLGDFARPELYHLAVRVGRPEGKLKMADILKGGEPTKKSKKKAAPKKAATKKAAKKK